MPSSGRVTKLVPVSSYANSSVPSLTVVLPVIGLLACIVSRRLPATIHVPGPILSMLAPQEPDATATDQLKILQHGSARGSAVIDRLAHAVDHAVAIGWKRLEIVVEIHRA